jgi:cell division protein FtsX
VITWSAQEALLSFRRRPWIHCGWVISLTLCLGCIGWVRAHAEGTGEVLRRLEPAGEVWAFLDQNADDARLRPLLARLRALPSVAHAELLSPAQVRRRLAAELRDPEAAAEIPEALLPRTVHVTPPTRREVSPAAVAILRAAPGIEAIDAGAKDMLRSRTRMRQIHLGAHLLSLLLTLTILLLGIALGRLMMALRRDEIAVLRLLGATKDRLIGPLLTTGIVVGLLAGAGGYGLSVGLGAWMAAATDLAVATPPSLAVRLLTLGVLTQVAGCGLGMLSELQRSEIDE